MAAAAGAEACVGLLRRRSSTPGKRPEGRRETCCGFDKPLRRKCCATSNQGGRVRDELKSSAVMTARTFVTNDIYFLEF